MDCLGAAVPQARIGGNIQVLEFQAILLQNGPQHRRVSLGNALVIVSLPKVRQHRLVLDAPGQPVRQGSLQAVAHLNPGAAVSDRYENQDAIVQFFVADAPLTQDSQCVLVGTFAAQITDGQDGNLRLSPLGQGLTVGIDGLFRLRGKDSRLVQDILPC